MGEAPARVLIVSTSAADASSASGGCMATLFGRWPPDRLMQLVRAEPGLPETSPCGHTIVVGDATGIDTWGTSEAEPIAGAMDVIRAFDPELLYVRAAEWPESWWRFGTDLAERLGVPYVFHIFDDTVGWCRANFPGGRGLIRSVRNDIVLRSCLEHAAGIFSCSPGHSQELWERYGVGSAPFVRTIGDHVPHVPHGGGTFRIGYAGRCNPLQHQQAFVDLATAVESLVEGGTDAHIECIGPNERDFELLFAEYPNLSDVVTFHGRLPTADDQMTFLNGCDALAVTLNFDLAAQEYIGYSLSSKALDAVALDLPVLVYGPNWLETVRWSKHHRWATVVDRRDPDHLREVLAAIVADPAPPPEQLEARRQLRIEWSADEVLPRFESAIINALDTPDMEAPHAAAG